MNERKQNPNDGAKKRLAEQIYVAMCSGNRALAVNKQQIAIEAREAAEAFYPDEDVPVPSIPITKAV